MSKKRLIHDHTGQRFGSWLVLRMETVVSGNRVWICRCDCGVEKPVYGSALRRGSSRRCIDCRRKRERERAGGRRFGASFSIREVNAMARLLTAVLHGQNAMAFVTQDVRGVHGRFERMRKAVAS